MWCAANWQYLLLTCIDLGNSQLFTTLITCCMPLSLRQSSAQDFQLSTQKINGGHDEKDFALVQCESTTTGLCNTAQLEQSKILLGYCILKHGVTSLRNTAMYHVRRDSSGKIIIPMSQGIIWLILYLNCHVQTLCKFSVTLHTNSYVIIVIIMYTMRQLSLYYKTTHLTA